MLKITIRELKDWHVYRIIGGKKKKVLRRRKRGRGKGK